MPQGRKPKWVREKLPLAGREHLDPAYVADYDRKSPTDWSDNILKLQALGIGAQSTVVDVGAGTGRFAEAMVRFVRRVVAVDVSAAMVAKMHKRGIEAVQAGFSRTTTRVIPLIRRDAQRAPSPSRKNKIFAAYTCLRT